MHPPLGHRSTLATLFLALGLALLVPACAKDGCAGSGPAKPPTKPAGDEPKPESSTVTVGVALPLTGPIASYGTRARQGMELALQDLEKTGTSPLKLSFEDDKNETRTAVALIRRFSDQVGTPVVVGTASSATTMAMTGVANQKKVVLFSPIASSPELTAKGGPFFFRLAPSDSAQASEMAKWFDGLGLKKVAILHTADTWGQSLHEAMKRGIEAAGGKVVAAEAVELGQNDYRVQLEKFKVSGADAFYVAAHPKDAGAFVKQVAQLGLKTPLFGADVCGAPEYPGVAGAAAEGTRFVAPARPSGQRYEAFAAAYKKAYNEEPEVYAAYAYDTVMILAAAARSGARSGEDFRKYLLAMKPHEGVAGTVSFDKDGDVVGLGFDRFVIKDGKPQRIGD